MHKTMRGCGPVGDDSSEIFGCITRRASKFIPAEDEGEDSLEQGTHRCEQDIGKTNETEPGSKQKKGDYDRGCGQQPEPDDILTDNVHRGHPRIPSADSAALLILPGDATVDDEWNYHEF